jgi:hypothetical protein
LVGIELISPSEHRPAELAGLPELTKMVGLHFEQAGFCGRGAAGPQQQANLRSTNSRSTAELSIRVGANGRFER